MPSSNPRSRLVNAVVTAIVDSISVMTAEANLEREENSHRKEIDIYTGTIRNE